MVEATPSPHDAAQDLRVQSWNVDGVIQFPIDPKAIAENLGIVVRYEGLPPDTAGYIVRRGQGETVIGINVSDAEVRRRFTLAHELGHYVRNRDVDADVGYVDRRNELASRGTDPAEVWCNRFAAELLMPASIVRKWWAEGLSPNAIQRNLGVSEAALANRLKNLRLLNA